MDKVPLFFSVNVSVLLSFLTAYIFLSDALQCIIYLPKVFTLQAMFKQHPTAILYGIFIRFHLPLFVALRIHVRYWLFNFSPAYTMLS